MVSRRSLLALSFALTLAAASGAQAFQFRESDSAAVKTAIAAGKPVVLHVYAPWCLQCRVQHGVLADLKEDPAYKSVIVFNVDYDGQKDAVSALNTPRATLISYRGGKEVARMSWEMSEAAVRKSLAAAL